VNTLVWPDGSELKTVDLAEALEQDLLLMSRETARTENNLAVVPQEPKAFFRESLDEVRRHPALPPA
jgi:hypothetical protein